MGASAMRDAWREALAHRPPAAALERRGLRPAGHSLEQQRLQEGLGTTGGRMLHDKLVILVHLSGF